MEWFGGFDRTFLERSHDVRVPFQNSLYKLERPCASQEGGSMLLRREGGFLRRGGGFLRRGGGS